MMLRSPLVSATDVLASLDDPRLRLVDVRWRLGRPGEGKRDYAAGHLPGAVFVDVDADLAAPEGDGRHPLPRPAEFERRMADLGIGDQHFVVPYDDVGGAYAARLWWMLDNLGHAAVAILDGGLQAWQEAGGPLTTEEPEKAPASLHLNNEWAGTIDRESLRARLGTVTLLDARAAERYTGEVEPIDPLAGHIPTARNAPYTDNLTDGRFKSPPELAERFRSLGAAAGVGTVVTSCGSGVNACHNALAMRIAGLPDPILYPGSFSDWSRAALPVATGDEPGEA